MVIKTVVEMSWDDQKNPTNFIFFLGFFQSGLHRETTSQIWLYCRRSNAALLLKKNSRVLHICVAPDNGRTACRSFRKSVGLQKHLIMNKKPNLLSITTIPEASLLLRPQIVAAEGTLSSVCLASITVRCLRSYAKHVTPIWPKNTRRSSRRPKCAEKGWPRISVHMICTLTRQTHTHLAVNHLWRRQQPASKLLLQQRCKKWLVWLFTWSHTHGLPCSAASLRSSKSTAGVRVWRLSVPPGDPSLCATETACRRRASPPLVGLMLIKRPSCLSDPWAARCCLCACMTSLSTQRKCSFALGLHPHLQHHRRPLGTLGGRAPPFTACWMVDSSQDSRPSAPLLPNLYLCLMQSAACITVGPLPPRLLVKAPPQLITFYPFHFCKIILFSLFSCFSHPLSSLLRCWKQPFRSWQSGIAGNLVPFHWSSSPNVPHSTHKQDVKTLLGERDPKCLFSIKLTTHWSSILYLND